ncbi:jg2792 [Pararge aegeria aegeria]|uniref:Jg2792 protein n=1 Tax=Pararge aegeria aegeria TaxID=348720 RepID=A0A8S4SQ94_9NEOP|nr:jg2792 [Pararge aegeria aegeria]
MKVFALILSVLALANGKGSGPYLYERPEGRAFFLPSEIVKPVPTPAIEVNLQGSEASGSDSLREYGPPKVQELSQNLLNQGLPDVTIEQTFGFSSQNAESYSPGVAEKVEISEVIAEVISTELPTTASQPSLDDNPPISAELPILDFEVKETTTTANADDTTEIISQLNQLTQESNEQLNQRNSLASLLYVSEQSNQENAESQTTELTNGQKNQQNSEESLKYQQESSTASDVQKVTATDSIGSTQVLLVNAVPASESEQNVPELQNIPDIIASLEKEILTQQAQVNQAVSELASVQALGPVPEGFLEYGPPGFVEYGPPKGDDEISTNIQNIESNETRRRRFSPRLRTAKKNN